MSAIWRRDAFADAEVVVHLPCRCRRSYRAGSGCRPTIAQKGDFMDDAASRFLDVIHDLEEIKDEITAVQAHVVFDETTLQVFWKKWPGLAEWAGSLWMMLSEEMAGPTTPYNDAELDEVGGSD
jgi:hypothetical protein